MHLAEIVGYFQLVGFYLNKKKGKEMQSSLVIKVMDELKTFLNQVNGTDD